MKLSKPLDQATIPSMVIFLLLTIVTAYVAGLGINEAVLDITGKPVKTDEPYFLQPAEQPDVWVSRDRRFPNMQCPLVATLSNTKYTARPVLFFLQSSLPTVPVSTSLSIRYGDSDPCPESGIWRVDSNSPFPAPDITATGKIFSESSTFKIEKDNDVYKLVYAANSSNIGVYLEPTTRIKHLVLDQTTPLNVIFIPAAMYLGQENSYFSRNNMVPLVY